VKGILEGEGKKADVLALEAIVEACGHDIRQVLNQVQFFGTAIAHAQGSQKDEQLQSTPFDACAKLLAKDDGKGKALPMSRKLDLFYIDADMVPLLIQENYLRPYEKANRTLNDEDLNTCAKAAEMIATGDAMQGSGDWGLMSSVAAIGTVYPSFLTSAVGPPIRPAFPTWLQKRGAAGKAARLAQELYAKIRPHTTCDRKDLMVSGYIELLHRRMLRPLASGDVKGCAAMLHSFGLTREFFTDQAPALRDPLKLDDPYKRVDGKARNVLQAELQELAARAPTKRVRQGDGGPLRKRARVEGEDAGTVGEEVDDDGFAVRKKEVAKKRRSADVDTSKCTLGGWRKKEEKKDSDGNVVQAVKKQAGILLKFIEGHTNAVRRPVQFADIVGPWRQF